MNPKDFSRLLVCSEKKNMMSSLGLTSKTLASCMTNKFDDLFTTDFKDVQDEEFILVNVLQRILVSIYRKSQLDLKGLDLVDTFVDLVLDSEKKLISGGAFSNEQCLIISLYNIVTLFLKENWTGKSWLFMNVEKWYEEERVIKSSEELMRKRRERLENVHFQNLNTDLKDLCNRLGISKEDFDSSDYGLLSNPEFSTKYDSNLFREHMLINGEDCYTTMKLMTFYMIAKKMTDVR